MWFATRRPQEMPKSSKIAKPEPSPPWQPNASALPNPSRTSDRSSLDCSIDESVSWSFWRGDDSGRGFDSTAGDSLTADSATADSATADSATADSAAGDSGTGKSGTANRIGGFEIETSTWSLPSMQT